MQPRPTTNWAAAVAGLALCSLVVASPAAASVAPSTGTTTAASTGQFVVADDVPTAERSSDDSGTVVRTDVADVRSFPSSLPFGSELVDVVQSNADEPVVPLVIGAGYSRWDASDPLDHETRARILDAVTETPGRSLSSTVAETDAARSTVRYHCRVLEHEELIERRTLNGRLCLFPADDRHGSRDETRNLPMEPPGETEGPVETQGPSDELAAALANETTRRTLESVLRVEPASVADVAEELGVARSTASHHLQRLGDDGLVERRREGRTVRTSLAPQARRWVEAHPTP